MNITQIRLTFLWTFILLGFADISLNAQSHKSWRWLNLPDWHAAEKYVQVWGNSAKDLKVRGWRQKGYDSLEQYQQAMLEKDVALLSRLKIDYGGELILIPGDTQGGHWEREGFRESMRSVYPDLSDEGVILRASHLCYGGMRTAFAKAGFPDLLVAVGDHEIGDNPWPPNSEVSRMVPFFRAGHADVFNEKPVRDEKAPNDPRLWTYGDYKSLDNRQFNTPIGAVPSRPLGTIYEETSFAWQYKNVLFITVDVFRQDSPGDRLGREGSVTGNVEGKHLQWFKDILRAASRIESIKHIIVQAHLPVLYPVRKYASSGMLMDDDRDSAFWEAMRDGGVDLYLAGEVHANTVTIDPQSDLVQWVARGVGATNFSTVDVSDDRLVVQAWKNKDPHDLGEDLLLGKLVIDKSNTEKIITTTGLLKAVNPDGLILHYNFDSLVPASSILSGITDLTVNDTACRQAFVNYGDFSTEYTAWANGTLSCAGRLNKAVLLVPEKSILGLSSMGPLSEGRECTIAMWVRTNALKRQILLNTTSFWGPGEFFNLSINEGRLELILSPNQQKITKYSGLNDGKWHHLVVTLPFDGAPLREVEFYIDGELQQDATDRGGSTAIKTSQANWIGLGVLLKKSKVDLEQDYGMRPFEGALDDFALWTRALTDGEVAQLFKGAAEGKNAFEMEQIFQAKKTL